MNLTTLKKYWLKRTFFTKAIIIVLFILITGFFGFRLFNSDQAKITYETAVVEKGTLIKAIEGSGTITSGNYTNINTRTSGTVEAVYVVNGDVVAKGQTIAEIKLDDYASERQAEAWASYLIARENALEAVSDQTAADINMWQAREAVLSAQEEYDNAIIYSHTNPETNELYTQGEQAIIEKTLDQTKKAFTLAESKYQNSSSKIINANAKVQAALRTYQENSAKIIAPADGIITDLSLASGLIISASSTTSNTSGATIVSSQSVGKIKDQLGQLVATVNLTEVDVVQVKADQKVNLTLDAYPDKSFTGKVLAVNTGGSVNSGVTTYPVTILLDPVDLEIYPNMAISASIITKIKTNIILVPSSAIETINDQEVVQVMKDNEPEQLEVETGINNSSQTEIISGLKLGDIVVTSVINHADSAAQTTGTSPFSGVGRTSGSGRTGMSGGGPGF